MVERDYVFDGPRGPGSLRELFVDLPQLLRDDQRTLGMFALPLATKCLAGMALQALNQRHTSLAEMWRRYDVVIHPLGVATHAGWVISRLESGDAAVKRT